MITNPERDEGTHGNGSSNLLFLHIRDNLGCEIRSWFLAMQMRQKVKLRVLLFLADYGGLSRTRLERLRRASVELFKENPKAIVSFLTAGLQTSRSPRRSLLLLWILKQLDFCEPESPELQSVLPDLPGARLLDRIHVCNAALSYALGSRVLNDHVTLVLHPRVDQLQHDAGPPGTPLTGTILNKQTDEAFSLWARSNRLKVQDNPAFFAELAQKLRTAAEQGDTAAKYLLALQCPRDREEKVRLLHDAAERGSLEALCALGVFYSVGELMPRDSAKGEALLRQAERRGSLTARVALTRLGNKPKAV